MKKLFRLDAIWLPEEVYGAAQPEPAADVVGIILLSILALSLAALAVTLLLVWRDRRRAARPGRRRRASRGRHPLK